MPEYVLLGVNIFFTKKDFSLPKTTGCCKAKVKNNSMYPGRIIHERFMVRFVGDI
jgi:hypothetical protein